MNKITLKTTFFNLVLLFALGISLNSNGQSDIIPQYLNNFQQTKKQNQAQFIRTKSLNLIKPDSATKVSPIIIRESTNNFITKFFSKILTNKELQKEQLDSLVNDFRDYDLSELNFSYRKETIKQLRNLAKKDTYNPLQVAYLDTIRNIFKDYNTYNGFLSKVRRPRNFWITDLKCYDTDSIMYYLTGQKGIGAFQNASIQNYNDATTIGAELGSFNFGIVRLGLGGYFSTKNDTAKDNEIKKSIQKMITNGGDITLNFSMPLWLIRDRKDQAHAGLFMHCNFGVSPGFSDSTKRYDYSDNILFNNQIGGSFHFDVTSLDKVKKARLFVEIPAYYVYGSKRMYERLGITDYSVVKAQVGLMLGDIINMKFSGPLYSTSETVNRTPFILTLNFSPSNSF